MISPSLFRSYAFLFLLAFLASCHNAPECQNGGTLDPNDNCVCTDGYTGIRCEMESREAYLGTFQGDFSSPFAENILQNPYMAVLEKNTDDVTRVNISINKAPFNTPFIGIINEQNMLYIPLQTVNGKALSGSANEFSEGINLNIVYDGFDFTTTLYR